MNVLSLFDGIATGKYALEKAGIKVNKYYTSEIDKFAAGIAAYNYPDIIPLGDVEKIDFNLLKGKIDLIIGGFPCLDLSLAGKREGLQGQHSRLFYKQLEAIKTIRPKYFLVENNVGMPTDAYEEITKQLGCYPIEINSSLLSAQSRRRYYWTNIGPQIKGLIGFPKCAIPQPKDKGILLKDILENTDEVATTSIKTNITEPICINSQSGRADGLAKQPSVADRIYDINGKGVCLTSGWKQNIVQPICINVPETVRVRKYEVNIEKLKAILREHKNLSNKEIAEKLNQPITKVEHWFRLDDYFAIPDEDIWFSLKALLNIQTDEFDKSITEFEEKLGVYEKSTRKYSVDGKMSTLLAGGNDEIINPIIITKKNLQKLHQRIYFVKDGYGKLISTDSDSYKMNLPDGYYVVRKLTPLECERLQTMPDEYTRFAMLENKVVEVSDAQRYKVLGNGWTADVIAYIFSYLKD